MNTLCKILIKTQPFFISCWALCLQRFVYCGKLIKAAIAFLLQVHFDSHCFTDLSSPADIQVGLQKPSILMLHPKTCNLSRDSRFKIPELDKPQLWLITFLRFNLFQAIPTLFFFISYNHGNKYTTECSKNQTGLENFKPKSTTLTNREELFSNIYAITKYYKGNRGHI